MAHLDAHTQVLMQVSIDLISLVKECGDDVHAKAERLMYGSRFANKDPNQQVELSIKIAFHRLIYDALIEDHGSIVCLNVLDLPKALAIDRLRGRLPRDEALRELIEQSVVDIDELLNDAISDVIVEVFERMSETVIAERGRYREILLALYRDAGETGIEDKKLILDAHIGRQLFPEIWE